MDETTVNVIDALQKLRDRIAAWPWPPPGLASQEVDMLLELIDVRLDSLRRLRQREVEAQRFIDRGHGT